MALVRRLLQACSMIEYITSNRLPVQYSLLDVISPSVTRLKYCPIRLFCPHSDTELKRLKEMEDMTFLQTLIRLEVAVKVHPSDTQSIVEQPCSDYHGCALSLDALLIRTTSLESLYLCSFPEADLRHLFWMRHLVELELIGCGLTDVWCKDAISMMPQLKILCVRANFITNTGFCTLSALQHLIKMVVDEPDVTGHSIIGQLWSNQNVFFPKLKKLCMPYATAATCVRLEQARAGCIVSRI